MDQYTPTFTKEDGTYIILDDEFNTVLAEEALAYGIVGQMMLAPLDYYFTGDIHWVRDVDMIIIKEVLPYTGRILKMGLIEGRDFNKLRNGEMPAGFINVSSELFSDRVFITETFSMNNDRSLDIAIAYNESTYEPYVLITDSNGNNDALTPEEAHLLGTELIHAAEASISDSTIRKALDTALVDGLTDEQKDCIIDAIRNLRQEDRPVMDVTT